MSTGISSYNWNPLLSPSYSSWSSIASGVNALAGNGLGAQNLSSISSAEANSTLFGGSPSASIYDTLSISPSAYSLLYNAANMTSNTLNGAGVSPQSFFVQAQQDSNPLFQLGSSDTTSLLSKVQNSNLESAVPSYYLNTFNPYSYLGSTSSLFDTLT